MQSVYTSGCFCHAPSLRELKVEEIYMKMLLTFLTFRFSREKCIWSCSNNFFGNCMSYSFYSCRNLRMKCSSVSRLKWTLETAECFPVLNNVFNIELWHPWERKSRFIWSYSSIYGGLMISKLNVLLIPYSDGPT